MTNDLQTKLKRLRAGLLDNDQISDAVAEFGRENFVESKPDVERMLDHPDPIVRYNTISTLAFEGFGTSRPDRFVEVLLSDPDDECRRIAAGALGTLFRGTGDELILSSLAKSALNLDEAGHVRKWAYKSFLEAAGLLPPEQRFAVPEDLGPWNTRLLEDAVRQNVTRALIVTKPVDGVFDRVKKVQQGIDGLKNQIATLDEALDEHGVSEADREQLERAKARVQEAIREAEAAIRP